jgi:hypothetical protein
VRGRLGHGGTRGRLPPGPLPVVDRPLGEPRLEAVPGEQLGLRVRRPGEALLQHPGDARVQPLPLRLEQALVGGITHQRVLERVARRRRLAPREHQLGRRQPVQGDPQLRLGQG